MSSAYRSGSRTRWGRRTLGLKLVVGYAGLFSTSVVVLCVIAYVLFIHFLREPDRTFIETQAQELRAAYERSGVQGLREELVSTLDERREELLVRLADRSGRTMLLYNPDDWKRSEISRLEQHRVTDGQPWIQLGSAEDNDELEAYVTPLRDGGVLQVGMDTDVRQDVLASMRNVFLAIALPVIILALLGGAVMSYRALRPVRQLVRTFQEVIDTGDVQRRVPVDGERGPFTELVYLFNLTLARIETLLSRMRESLDNVAHDLRTPVTQLRGRAELALQGAGDAEAYREALGDALEVSDTLLTILNTTLDVAEAEVGAMVLRKEELEIAPLVQSVAAPYTMISEEKGVTLEVDVPVHLCAVLDRSRMRRVVANLLDNAVKYTPPGGTVRVAAEDDGRELCIIVQDTGIGIPAEEVPRIWDRLYRGDQSRSERGLGLGLSLVKAIVGAHDGHVTVHSALGRGSVFVIHLPRTAKAHVTVL
ncbi:MAG TPA: ATP-binding protein [Rhodothermales bacterium]|nr:ATP-binding protein [Rhodothermales bacterium]